MSPAFQRLILSFALRNAVLEADFARKGFKLPAARKTGTTIAGVVYKVSPDRPGAAVTELVTGTRALGLLYFCRLCQEGHILQSTSEKVP